MTKADLARMFQSSLDGLAAAGPLDRNMASRLFLVGLRAQLQARPDSDKAARELERLLGQVEQFPLSL